MRTKQRLCGDCTATQLRWVRHTALQPATHAGRALEHALTGEHPWHTQETATLEIIMPTGLLHQQYGSSRLLHTYIGPTALMHIHKFSTTASKRECTPPAYWVDDCGPLGPIGWTTVVHLLFHNTHTHTHTHTHYMHLSMRYDGRPCCC